MHLVSSSTNRQVDLTYSLLTQTGSDTVGSIYTGSKGKGPYRVDVLPPIKKASHGDLAVKNSLPRMFVIDSSGQRRDGTTDRLPIPLPSPLFHDKAGPLSHNLLITRFGSVWFSHSSQRNSSIARYFSCLQKWQLSGST